MTRSKPYQPVRASLTLAGAMAGTLGLAACASAPSPALENARTAYERAEVDPGIQQNAPLALRDAEQALARAEAARAEGADREEIEHLAYLAQQRVAIAEARAAEKGAQSELQQLGENRQEILLQARTQKLLELQRQLEELEAERTERGIVVTLEDILFDVNRADLKPGAQGELVRIADFLQANPERSILIEGHTDSTGSSEYNLELSQRRAEAVRNFLTLNGVSPARIRAVGYGETRPEASNDSAAGRQQNRRVEIVILDEGQPLPTPTFGQSAG